MEELDSLAAAASSWLPQLAQQPEENGANNEDATGLEKPVAGAEHRTDLGNSERLIRYFGEDLAYTKQWEWLFWDGRRWTIDDTGQVMRYAKQAVRLMYGEAFQIAGDNEETKDDRAKLAAHALASESANRLRAMISLTQSNTRVAATTAQFDAAETDWYLNCANGAIDLHTGKLEPHERSQRITKITSVLYDPAATCPTWNSCLATIMDNNQALISFLQRAAGYSLTGSTREQVMFLLHGGGSNGKSTLIRTLLHVLGDYGQTTPATTLLTRDRDSANSNDLARMAGVRFVSAVETEDGKRLAESLIKQITGGDTITARFLHKEYFEFQPKFKLWFATNHRPVIKGTDEAIWRRILLIPFAVHITAPDKSLPERLAAEASGILNWALEGCRQW